VKEKRVQKYEWWAEHYERGRPGYPPESLDVAELPDSAEVLEIGAGTGKLTRLLVSRFASVTAIEPKEHMRQILSAVCPQAAALEGSAERIPLADASVDAVFAAEAFHWFANERAVAEIARVLRPGGSLVLMWNIPGGTIEPSIEAAQRLLDERVPNEGELSYDPMDLSPNLYMSGEWRTPFANSPFEDLREARLRNLQTLNPDSLVAFFASMGWILDLPAGERDELLTGVRSALIADKYVRPWETRVHWTRLASEGAR
jgi:SAM-dependent methyltransferase